MRRRTFLNHALFWALFLATALGYNTIVHHNGSFSLGLFLAEFKRPDTYVEYGRVATTFYVSLWVFTHHFFPKYFAITFLQILLLGAWDAAFSYALYYRFIPFLTGTVLLSETDPGLGRYFIDQWIASLLYVLLALLFNQGQQYLKNEALRQEKNAIELSFLKAQLNPHFLFNTLNNLYGLALTEPVRMPDALLKLAELMRYMLYESNETLVELVQEIDYLNSYIALEKLRHDGGVYVDFTVEGNINGYQIAPLLLISFVENAFKHGSIDNPQQPVELRLTARGGQLTFSSHNQIVRKNKDQVGGVGLQSVQRRLTLLYPGQHQLTITQEAGCFHCSLELQGVARVSQTIK
ncbi:sensor histidine kinase [Hymenobacter sp. BT664]|uniref:Sensor histidine kinase n=1 Tax=Hymenobacter montanus TaxID=2771359 RepID=A0A927BA47_9BACT|nr:sensor histidine kinase [Hymenobacter montanus]MBD2766911.1 sensor histidine kinase [Hymenobacter montanus]